MTELQNDTLMRYLHERGEMSVAERFVVEWQLLTDAACRLEYADMDRMHRSLSSHFAPNGDGLIPVPSNPWIRLGVAGLTGAVALSVGLLWVQDVARTEHLKPSKPVVSGSLCLQCAVNGSKTGHCSHAVKNDSIKAGVEKPLPAKIPSKKTPLDDCGPQ